MNNKLAEEIQNLKVKNFKYWSAHYAKEAENIQNQLKTIGLSKNDLILFDSCNEKFNNLISIAEQLQLEELSSSNLILSLNDLFGDKSKTEMSIFNLEKENGQLKDKLLQLNLFHETLIKDSQTIDSQVNEDKQKLNEMEMNIEFMRNKLDKYSSQLKELEDYNGSIDKDLTHESLIAEYKNFKSFKIQLQEAKSKLDIYQDLPANASLAKLKLQTIKNEIDALDREIERRMSYIH